jgi:hypothetical protein
MSRKPSEDDSRFSKISPDAWAHVDSEGLKLLAGLKPPKKKRRSSVQSPWSPDIEGTRNITEKEIIGGVKMTSVDQFSMERTSFEWDSTGMILGLYECEYTRFVSLAGKISSFKPLAGALNASTAESVIIEWLTAVRTGATASSLSLWFESRMSDVLKVRKICVPIAWLHLQREVNFGGCRLIPLNRATKELWQKSFAEKKMEGDKEWAPRGLLAKAFKMAWTGMLVEVFGDEDSCQSQALQRAYDVCGLLRFFWPGNRILGSRCFVLPLGLDSQPQHSIIELEADCPVWFSEGIDGPPGDPLILSDSNLVRIERSFRAISELLEIKKHTEFQKKVLSSILLFTRNSLHTDVVDRLIAVLVALESILLRSASEPIQSSLSQRLAVLTKDTVDDRMRLRKV